MNTARRTTAALAMTIALSGLAALPAAADARPQQRAFRGDRLVISSAAWAVNDIKIGNRSQFTQIARQVIDNSAAAQVRTMGTTLAGTKTDKRSMTFKAKWNRVAQQVA